MKFATDQHTWAEIEPYFDRLLDTARASPNSVPTSVKPCWYWPKRKSPPTTQRARANPPLGRSLR